MLSANHIPVLIMKCCHLKRHSLSLANSFFLEYLLKQEKRTEIEKIKGKERKGSLDETLDGNDKES